MNVHLGMPISIWRSLNFVAFCAVTIGVGRLLQHTDWRIVTIVCPPILWSWSDRWLKRRLAS